MIPLAVNVAILDKFTRRTCLETSTSLFAAIGTADAVNLVVHHEMSQKREDEKRGSASGHCQFVGRRDIRSTEGTYYIYILYYYLTNGM